MLPKSEHKCRPAGPCLADLPSTFRPPRRVLGRLRSPPGSTIPLTEPVLDEKTSGSQNEFGSVGR